jgi:plastocyanin
MTKPIGGARRIRCVRVVAALLAVMISVLLGAAGAAHADNPVLTGDVGVNDSFTITLTDANGARVTHLDTGTYTLRVHDHSAFHDFHLSGPGNVDVSTTPDFVGDQTFTVTLVDGQYFFQCDPHSSQMKGNFTVGTFTAPPPKPTPAAAQKLAASIGPGASFRLGPLAGVSAGKAVITVSDRSAKDGFRLAGPGVARTTGAKFRGTVKWTVTLQAGKYSYGGAKQRKSFTVSG